MEKLLGKSDGVSLLEHSRAVEIVSEIMSKIIFNSDFNEEHLENIKLAALLHDIGKCVKQYQNLFNNIKSDEEVNLLHNEIGWAVLKCFNISDNVLNSIYWHHAKPTFGDKNISNDNLQSVLKKISDEDLETICEFYSFITKKVIDKNIIYKNFNDLIKRDNKTPEYYKKSIYENSVFLSYRNIIVSADRLVSLLNKSELELVLKRDYKFIESLINEEKALLKYIIPEKYDILRFKKQEEIILDITKNSAIIKAPAGFGKTILGLLWSLKSNKKLLWVCPRNVVVTSVYESINEEIKALGLENKLSIELFLTGERKACTNDKIKEYNSDIVITNIDNYLNVVTENKYSDRGYAILNRDVVFDEFHEFINEAALFSCFVTLMQIRHRYTNSKTLLLSATPSLIQQEWDNSVNKTLILPSNDKHYIPAHNKNYLINLFNNDENIIADLDSLTITNTIKNSQILKKEKNFDLLLHSKFTEEDKECNINLLKQLYGKESRYKTNRYSVISAPIIQASLDISFNKLTEFVMSPETTLQRIGRCNRWGNYDDSVLNFILSSDNKSENSAIRYLYDNELNKLWSNFLHNNLKEKVTLTELYDIYNNFNLINSVKIKKYISDVLDESLNNLVKIIPQKNINVGENKTKTNKIKNISNKDNLRTNGYNFFVTYRMFGSDEFIEEPFSETIKISRESDFDEDYRTSLNVSKVIKELIVKKTFNFKKRHTKMSLDQLHKLAYCNETPYIALNKLYSKEYGLADLEIYEN